ncbi:MAG: hypothetical protein Q9160_000237 [Pyrenula sp. 1 TL-2023]
MASRRPNQNHDPTRTFAPSREGMIRDQAWEIINLGDKVRNLEYLNREKEASLKELENKMLELKRDNAALGVYNLYLVEQIKNTTSSNTSTPSPRIRPDILEQIQGNEIIAREVRRITANEGEAEEGNGDAKMTSEGSTQRCARDERIGQILYSESAID